MHHDWNKELVNEMAADVATTTQGSGGFREGQNFTLKLPFVYI